MNHQTTYERPNREAPAVLGMATPKQHSPWTNDFTLMSLSLWWVHNTQPDSDDVVGDVQAVMADLQRDLVEVR